MVERALEIRNPSGLHARPASALVQTAQRYASSITIDAGGQTADAKSILEVLMLGAERGARVHLTVDGPDETPAMQALVALIEGGLGESTAA